MATNGYSDLGEEWSQKFTWRQDTITRPATVSVLLYNDGTDALSDSSDVGDITTEPGDGNYTRQTLTLDGTDLSLSVDNGDLRVEGSVTFDTTNSTGMVDAAAVVADFTSDVVNSESSAQTHLLHSATLDIGEVDLNNFTSIEVTPRLDLD